MAQNVFITGSSSGFGQLITKNFLEEGYNVFASMRQPDGKNAEKAQTLREFAENKSGKLYIPEVDVTKNDQINKAVNEAVSQEGSIDILVNNAGISHIGNVENTPEEDFDKVYQVNVKGMYNCLQSAVAKMKENGGGSIVNMASIASVVGIPDRFAYSMSKGAVYMMTMSVARDFLNEKIRFN